MVKLLLFISLFSFPLFAIDEPTDIKFVVEFSKTEVYIGEQILCHFIVFTHEPALDVEVVKFPEFKGFWKENLSLRQGPLQAMPHPNKPWNHVMIGSYLLTAMSHSTETATPALQPMKIAVRKEGTPPDDSNRTYFSEGPVLKIKPLPPFPKELNEKQFTGAVGNFSQWVVERNLIFTPKEPLLIRFQLTGEGNFPEISSLPIPWPEGIRVISERNQTWGSVSHSIKTFEYTVVVDKNDPIDLNLPDLVYFSPDDSKWHSLKAPEVRLSPRPEAEIALAAPAQEIPPAFEETFTIHRPWYSSPFFGILNLLACLSVVILRRQSQKAEPAPVTKEVEVKNKINWEGLINEVDALYRKGELESYLKKAYLLSQKIADKDASTETIKFTYEYYFFSGAKEWKVSPDRIKETLHSLVKTKAESIR